MNWTEIFQVQSLDTPAKIVERGECNENCLDAKELKCVCRCNGKNHGAHLKKEDSQLEQFQDGEQE